MRTTIPDADDRPIVVRTDYSDDHGWRAVMRAPHPLLAVSTVTRDDCEDDEHYAYEMEHGREFRLLPAGLVSVSANLSIANMDFPEFAGMAAVDPEGVYRGDD